MSRKSNQKQKILHLMEILLNRTDEENGLTLAEIIDSLGEHGIEAERKSLYDDFEVLRTFGIDIEQRKSKDVRYHVVSRDFELPELKLLVDAVQSSKFITRKKSNELIKKIEGLTSRHEAQQLQRQVYVSNRIKTMNESIYYSVDYIHEAISKNVKITFKYFDWNEKKEKILRHDGQTYCISPWALTWDDENYYLIGFDSISNKIKHYRVDKMEKISISEEKRDGSEFFKNFDMAVYSKQTFGMFGGEEKTVVLRCANELAGVMIDRFGQDIAMTPARDPEHKKTHFEIRVKVYVSPTFLAWLTTFGANVTIIEPNDVKDKFIQLAKSALEQY